MLMWNKTGSKFFYARLLTNSFFFLTLFRSYVYALPAFQPLYNDSVENCYVQSSIDENNDYLSSFFRSVCHIYIPRIVPLSLFQYYTFRSIGDLRQHGTLSIFRCILFRFVIMFPFSDTYFQHICTKTF